MTDIRLRKMNPGQIGKYARFIPREDIPDALTGKLVFDNKEDEDDILRSIKMLKAHEQDVSKLNERRKKVMRKKK